ncbi:MAG: hypothetical protein IPQ24_02200 [Anaeromyxobacter sp.]|nr:hypothetical protein [Anaeromyxobacter sp.]
MNMDTLSLAVDAPDQPSAKPAAPAGYQVAEAGEGRYEVQVSGPLPTGWAGRLASGLAAQRVNVVRGGAARRGGHQWEVALLIEPFDRTVDPRAIDWLALAQEGQAPPPREAGSLALEAFSLTRTVTDLVVDVDAVDSLGFLDRILRVFALYGLFPHELHLETRGQKVRDQFRLLGLGGAVPSLQVCEAVGLKLRELAGTVGH